MIAGVEKEMERLTGSHTAAMKKLKMPPMKEKLVSAPAFFPSTTPDSTRGSLAALRQYLPGGRVPGHRHRLPRPQLSPGPAPSLCS